MIKNNLFVQAIGKFLLGVILIGLLLFLPAESYDCQGLPEGRMPEGDP